MISEDKSMKQPKHQAFTKFLLLLLIVFSYFAYLSYQYDLMTGGIAALITWSFFVLCSPVADAGFLLDFPVRLLFGVRMVISEIVVWVVAIVINILALLYFSDYYQTTVITQIMHLILTNPIPYWAVIVLSCIGTFLSIRFGDELMDVLHHKDRMFYLRHHFKYEIILFVFFLFILLSYYEIISELGVVMKQH